MIIYFVAILSGTTYDCLSLLDDVDDRDSNSTIYIPDHWSLNKYRQGLYGNAVGCLSGWVSWLLAY